MLMRIGHGYDIHRFDDKNDKDFLMLGGVKIPYEKGLLAHSDGDVVLHAICDALLGASALGDIGQHFPDTDPAYKNCDSRELLRQVLSQLHVLEYKIGNVDVSIIAQAPKMAPHIQAMRQNIAADLQVNVNAINVKATTHEGLDAIGQKLGIAVHAVALITQETE